MRDFKFRGYATEEMVNSQWLYGTGIHVVEYTEEYFKETGIKEKYYLFTDSGWVQVEEGSIGQYTGLKDIKGKEIYEGDYLAHRDVPFFEVIFDDESACFMVATLDAKRHDFISDYISEVEVIGNIYEDYTLLKSE